MEDNKATIDRISMIGFITKAMMERMIKIYGTAAVCYYLAINTYALGDTNSHLEFVKEKAGIEAALVLADVIVDKSSKLEHILLPGQIYSAKRFVEENSK